MSHRQFEDESGRLWEAWDVYPSTVERHLNSDHPTTSTGNGSSGRSMTFTLPAELRAGWLAFQCDSESRRLAPIPENWTRMSDSDLTRLASQAKPIVRASKVRAAHG
jgi:hypothetical protein